MSPRLRQKQKTTKGKRKNATIIRWFPFAFRFRQPFCRYPPLPHKRHTQGIRLKPSRVSRANHLARSKLRGPARARPARRPGRVRCPPVPKPRGDESLRTRTREVRPRQRVHHLGWKTFVWQVGKVDLCVCKCVFFEGVCSCLFSFQRCVHFTAGWFGAGFLFGGSPSFGWRFNWRPPEDQYSFFGGACKKEISIWGHSLGVNGPRIRLVRDGLEQLSGRFWCCWGLHRG